MNIVHLLTFLPITNDDNTGLFPVSPKVRISDPFSMANILIYSQSLKQIPELKFPISKLAKFAEDHSNI
jgi:hypothetical protein